MRSTVSDAEDISVHLKYLRLAVEAAQIKLLFVLRLKELQSVEFSFVGRVAQTV